MSLLEHVPAGQLSSARLILVVLEQVEHKRQIEQMPIKTREKCDRNKGVIELN
jgi:hypothetical protein